MSIKTKKSQITPANSKDAETLTELTLASKAHWGYSPGQMALWTNELTIDPAYIATNKVYKLLLQNKLIGYYSYYLLNKTQVYLDNLFIHPDHIGNGYGCVLMQDFLTRIQNSGLTSIQLESDPNAKNFYLKFGFIVVELKESSIKGRYLPIMEKSLD